MHLVGFCYTNLKSYYDVNIFDYKSVSIATIQFSLQVLEFVNGNLSSCYKLEVTHVGYAVVNKCI